MKAYGLSRSDAAQSGWGCCSARKCPTKYVRAAYRSPTAKPASRVFGRARARSEAKQDIRAALREGGE